MKSLSRIAVAVCLAAALLPAVRASAADITVDEAVAATLSHVRDHASELGATARDVRDLLVTDAYRSPHNGVHHVYLRQLVKGLEVLEADLTAGVLPDGTVFHTGSRLRSGLDRAASGRRVLDAQAAVNAAAVHVGLPAPGVLPVLEPARGASGLTLLGPGSISLSPIPARLVYQPARAGKLRLAWTLSIEDVSKLHWWDVTVDAQNGRVLDVRDYVDHEHAEPGPADGSSYRVYARPLESPNDGERTLEASPADATASPFGWHDVDGVPGAEYTITRGNNAYAHVDVTGSGVQLISPDGGPELSFDYPIDFTQDPWFYKEAATTNLFYWNNVVHDVFYGYGFDEAAGNFQDDNYAHGGEEGDPVNADAQDTAGIDNATFATPADGSSPRMQMYRWLVGRSFRDGDFDSAVITHEYGHGISNRLTGGPANVRCLDNDEQAGEGWSDFLGIALTARPGDKGADRRGVGTYVLGQPSRQNVGIRPSPYSTSMFINPARYDAVKTAAVPHGVGWVWASMLWEAYWALVGVHGFNPDASAEWSAGGNNLAIQLVIDGMKLQPCSPGFADSRDAILAADTALTGGANQCVLWAAFAKRGLGFSAVQGSSGSVTDGSQAFDVPAGC